METFIAYAKRSPQRVASLIFWVALLGASFYGCLTSAGSVSSMLVHGVFLVVSMLRVSYCAGDLRSSTSGNIVDVVGEV